MLVESAATHLPELTAWDLDLVDLDFDIPLDQLDHERLTRPVDELFRKHPSRTAGSGDRPVVH